MQYVNASSAAHALQELIKADGEAVILAGGSDLIVDTKAGKIHPQFFIDVTKASDMIGIEVKDGALVIGAATTLTEITRSPLVKKYYPSLAEGCGAVGSLQIRNSATLVGNVVTAQPAADGAMALSPLGAVLTVLSADGETQIPMEEMYAGIARSRVDHGRELVTKITIPLPEAGEAAAYSCLELRKSLALPMLSCAAMVHMESGCVVWSRIRIAPVGVGPARSFIWRAAPSTRRPWPRRDAVRWRTPIPAATRCGAAGSTDWIPCRCWCAAH